MVKGWQVADWPTGLVACHYQRISCDDLTAHSVREEVLTDSALNSGLLDYHHDKL